MCARARVCVRFAAGGHCASASIFFEKQELPFAETLDEVTVLASAASGPATLGVFGEKSILVRAEMRRSNDDEEVIRRRPTHTLATAGAPSHHVLLLAH